LDGLLAELLDELDLAEPDPVSTYRRLDLCWARLAVHIRAEHLVLFPAVLASLGDHDDRRDDLVRILGQLRHDHDFFMKELARAVKALRLIPDFGNEHETFEVVKELVNGVETRLSQHNRIEEEIVYPLADRAIRSRVLNELESLPPRFSTTSK
jgi:iron-sulfur cluster repair protein YtfE (RIC family)